MFLCGPHSQLGGPAMPQNWEGYNKLGDASDTITVEVNNVLTEKKIHNVFGVIKGFVDSGKGKLKIKGSKNKFCLFGDDQQ